MLESNPYPGKSINKLECVCHIQKRVGAAAVMLVKGNRGVSGKGEGQLTRKFVDTFQNYYGEAIRSSRHADIQTMKFTIAAVLLSLCA